MAMISLLARNDYPLPGQVVSILMKNLVHDNIYVRKGALNLLGSVLRQQKKPHPKVTIEIPNTQKPRKQKKNIKPSCGFLIALLKHFRVLT
jgi:hypothetical protein